MKLCRQLIRAAWGSVLTAVLVARATPVKFDLPAQPAATALVAFARQAGVEVLFSFDELKKIPTPAVAGTFEPEEALARLLRGTGYTAQRNAAGKFVVTRDARPRRTAEIRGLLLSASGGGPVSGAVVRLADDPRGVRSGDDGGFLLRDVPFETKALVVSAEGFVTARVPGLVLQAGRRTELGPVRLTHAGEGAQQLGEMIVNADGLAVASGPVLLALQEMIVTPSRYGIDEERGTIAATLTESDLLALPQLGEDLYRAISHLPGLAADDVTARFWVRGAPHEQVLARLDGVELIEPFHLKDTDSSLSILDLETISRLDLYTGGFSTEYGDRLAGVLAMETDSYARAHPRTTLGLSLTGARAASRGRTANGRGRWLLSGRTGYPDLALEQTNDGDSNEIRPRYHDVMAKWEHQLTPDHMLSFHVLHAGDTMFFRDSGGPVLSSRYGSDYVWARWQGNFGGRYSGEGVLSFARVTWRRDGSGLLDRLYRIEVRDRRQLDLWTLRQDWNASLSERALMRGGFELKAGQADYDYHALRDQVQFRAGAFRIERTTRDAAANPDGRMAAGYAALRVQPWPELTLEPGLRYEGNDYAHDALVTPRFTASLHRGCTTWRAAWGSYAQAQGLHQLGVLDGDVAFHPAERAEHRVLSVEQRLPHHINLRLEGYERIIRHPRPHFENVLQNIDAVAEIESDRRRLDPVRFTARGVELIAERRVNEGLSWSASYAYARSTETLAAGETILRPRDQRHTLYVDATYTPSPRWQFSAAWQFHTGWPATELTFARVALADGGTAVVSNIGSYYGLRLPAYQRVDLRAQRRFQLPRGTLRVYLDLFNAFDRKNTIDYAYSVNVDAGGRLSTVRRRGESLFPLLPTFGATWDF